MKYAFPSMRLCSSTAKSQDPKKKKENKPRPKQKKSKKKKKKKKTKNKTYKNNNKIYTKQQTQHTSKHHALKRSRQYTTTST